MPGAVVCVEAEVLGDVKIGSKTIIHPCAKIHAKKGPIVLGDFNIVEELAIIVNWLVPYSSYTTLRVD